MNFFEQQDIARRQTRKLVGLFLLAVCAIVIAINLVAALLWIWMQGGTLAGPNYYPYGFFASNTLVTLMLIGGGTLVEIYNLRDGGDAVARMAGGRLLPQSSQDLHERRMLNVTAEMALASGIACPQVYVLDKEESINAFAAGYSPNEAVVAVTRGTLTRLSRDELQGVVAHEFSHILNGDMRLNIRLIGLLFGIQMIANFGSHLIDFGARTSALRSRNEKGPPLQLVLLALGVAMYLIGYIGIFFGRLIKSAVSRQREYLADASAVQFTRNPDGIGGALRKIGGLSRGKTPGSEIRHPNAEQLSHLFMGAPKASLVSGLFATHPPIAERLRRIYGRGVSMLEAPEMALAPIPPEAMHEDLPYPHASSFTVGSADPAGYGSANGAAATGAAGPNPAAGVGRISEDEADVADADSLLLRAQLERTRYDPYEANALVYAMLIEEGAARPRQIGLLGKQGALVAGLADALHKLPKSARLSLLDLAMPALRELSPSQREALLTTVTTLIAADEKISLTEFVLETILSRRLDPHAGRSTPVRFASLAQLKGETAVLLSLVAHVGSSGRTASKPLEAFQRGAERCPGCRFASVDLVEAPLLGIERIRQALDRCNQLAPLAKPALIKALLAAGMSCDTLTAMPVLPVHVADLLRAVCAGLDSPVPPVVSATYAETEKMLQKQ